MELKKLGQRFSICKVQSLDPVSLKGEFCFIGKTDEELSLVCASEHAPENSLERDDGWRAFRIQGVLDFSLVGILAPIATLLAEEDIGIFAVSTFNTDYVLVKEPEFEHALETLSAAGYAIV